MRFLISVLLLTILSFGAQAQVENPVAWSVKTTGNKVVVTAKIDKPWHMYDMGPYDGGPNATTVVFKLPAGVTLIGGVKQVSKPTKNYDEMFGMDIGYFAGEAVFEQQFNNTTNKNARITVTVEWQVCDDESCLPPMDEDLTFEIGPTASSTAALTPGDATSTANIGSTEATETTSKAITPGNENAPEQPTTVGTVAPVTTDAGSEDTSADSTNAQELSPGTVATSTEVADSEIRDEQKSLWAVLVEAVLWGFAALMTPCVFPMVPMTVSFFMKSSGGKARGRFLASIYGISIVALYTIPIAAIIAITYFAGGEAVTADIFNWLATHWIPNVLFFVIFLVFAISFFGAFEITMPSKLVNKSDSQADKGGLVGTFFMAMTLVLVSFSCTGPIVGTILVKSTQGEIWEPIITMVAFSAAFALPFTIFAFFPSLLKNLPKSGGWLNSVKVVLGFIELALGLKFLSVADQTYHWGLLDREVYLALWIVIFTLLGLYLLGKIRFAHDSEMKHLPVKRLFMAICSFTFVVYMIPGMWGAPLKALSGYLPPVHTLDFDLSKSRAGGGSISDGSTLDLTKIEGGKPKYSDFLHLPHGLEGFFNYEQGLAYAKAVGKPVMLDFTGHGCVNCREMEANVWSDPAVLSILSRDYVIIALYVDDKKELPESEWITDARGKVQKTIGKINAAFEIARFGVNAQPYYVLMNPQTEQLLVQPRAYNLDKGGFITFLREGIKAYNEQKK